ncbi:MAG: hypothetical protein ABIN69_01615 [Aestuariivirga sp.]
MKVLFTVFCILTGLFVGGCGLMLMSMGGVAGNDPVTLLVSALFVSVVVANIVFIVFANSKSPNRGKNLKTAAIIYAVLLAVSLLIVGNNQRNDSILEAILLTVAGFATVKVIFAFLLGAKLAKDDETKAAPPSPGEEVSP